MIVISTGPSKHLCAPKADQAIKDALSGVNKHGFDIYQGPVSCADIGLITASNGLSQAQQLGQGGALPEIGDKATFILEAC
ncbi:MAG TPA: hypothetical protein VF472_01610 [Burkholderiaceae bacterium]